MQRTILHRTLTSLALVALVGVGGVHAQTTTFKLGAGYDDVGGLVNGVVTNDEAHLGTGSFYRLETPGDGTKFEAILAPGNYAAPFTVGDVVAIRYRTKVDRLVHPQLDFYLTMYTVPDGVDDDASWYGRRFTGEPLYSVGRDVSGDPNGWVEWTTADTNVNELRWYDSNNNGGVFGSYTDPTFADLQAGPFDWSALYPGGDPTPIDYASETVNLLYVSTGSGWADFEGYVDAVEFVVDRGGSTETLVFDFEGPVSEAWVDDDWAGLLPGQETSPGSGRFMAYDAYATVQGGVDNVTGSTVNVAAGTYVEQVVIGSDLDLLGAGIGVSNIVAPATLTSTFSRGSTNFHPVVSVLGGTSTLIQGFTVDGAGNGAANRAFVGVGFHNAGGTLDQCRVTGIRENPLNGNQHGLGVYGIFDDLGTHAVACTNSEVDDFQKNGVTFNAYGGTVLDVTLTDNVVTGAGVLTAVNGDPAQNGIQVQGVNTTSLISGNTVSGINYDNTTASTPWVATSILLFFGNTLIENNVVGPAQAAVYLLEGSGVMRGNDVTVEKVGVGSYGLIVTDPPHAVPQGFEVDPSSGVMARRAGALSVSLENNVVTAVGPDITDTIGIEADMGYVDYAGDGPETMDLSIVDNQVNGFDYGVALFECASGCTGSVFTSIAINQNDFSGNNFGLYSDVTSAAVDASCNWWGDASGPALAANPAGTGAGIDGAVDFQPWLDGPGGACVLSTDYAAVGPAPSELNDCTNCIDVPVTLSRTDTSAARGVSVTFELSAELELCGVPVVSSGAGAFYDGYVASVQSYLIDNGGGSYTFDTAILGGACGPTVGGEVFTIPVQRAAGVVADVVGTVIVTDVVFRDCNNAPLPMLPGPGATIEIDVTAPGAVTNLVAAQVRTGNDADGTTKIDLSWDNPADADVTAITIYRKGFGFYPEYDDAGGSVPTAPATPGAAGWTLVTTLPAGTTSYADEPGTRDFWYYVAFAEDECYTSPVSNITDGELNYHLGDVASPPTGDNQVYTNDISALGAAYGTVDGGPNYNAAVDVGPTTDFSVTARPTTDDRIQFEDLIVFAINFNQVSRAPVVATAPENALELPAFGALEAGTTVNVPIRMSGRGDLLGVSVSVGWNENVLEYVGWSAGDLMSSQGRTAPVFSPQAGVIDAAVMGAGGAGISGEGVLASLQFRVKQSGDADLRFVEIDARNALNERVALDGTVISGAPTAPSVITRSALQSNVPNPFNPSTKVRFAVAVEGPVTLKIFDVSGRLVRTLVDGVRGAGDHSVVWNGTDDGGRVVSSGTYLLRMQAPDASASRRLVLLK